MGVIHNILEGCFFSFYVDSEILKLSVLRISNPITFDLHNLPTTNGLYDQRLGPCIQRDLCASCGQNIQTCPGHFGHIELQLPVYNPMTLRKLSKLLRHTCLHCYYFKFIISKNITLLNKKYSSLEKKYFLISFYKPKFKRLILNKKNIKFDLKSKDILIRTDIILRRILAFQSQMLKLIADVSNNSIEILLLQITSKKCNNCKKNSPMIKMLGISKFQIQEFQIPESIMNEIKYLKMHEQLKWIKKKATKITLVEQRLIISKSYYEVNHLKRKKFTINQETNF